MASSTGGMTLSDKEVSPLLELPPELRNTIYQLALTAANDGRIEITFNAVKKQTPLLRVCSQIRREATPIFYAANTFLITDILGQQSEAARFLKNAGGNTKAIQQLTVRVVLPKLMRQLMQVGGVVGANIGAEGQHALLEATEHMRNALGFAIAHSVGQLLGAGMVWSNISIEKLGDGLSMPLLSEDQAMKHVVWVLETWLQAAIHAMGAVREGEALLVDGADQDMLSDDESNSSEDTSGE